jgi:predicted outer membrane repeat protein
VVFAGIGGGIYNERASLTITDSTVSSNEATVAGGGISAGSVTLNNSTVSGNTALEGGGIYAASITLNNSTVSDNTALRDIEREYGGLGGGIIDFESLTLNGSSSVIDNEAAEHGGGIYSHETGGATITDGIGWSGTVSGNKPDDIFNF